MHTVIPRDTLRDFLSRHAAPGADFPTGARMQAAGHAHAEADALDCGYDYEHTYVAHSIAEWVTHRDARAYLQGYQQGRDAAIANAIRQRNTIAAMSGMSPRDYYATQEDDGQKCQECDGTGNDDSIYGCPACDGTGTATCPVDTDCPDCGGDGIIPAIGRGEYVPCPACHEPR